MNSADDFELLATAAYKGERVASRRLAMRTQITEHEALHQVLTLAAGTQGLAHLLAERSALRERDALRLQAKATQRSQALALRRERMQAASTGWRAWFDGSAHPNPGQIGIGALLCGPNGERVEISRRAGHGNSSEAEYLALTALLEAAREQQAHGLVIYGDSQVVVNDVNLSEPAVAAGRGAKGLEAHRARVQELMAAVSAASLRWIPRHRNGDADRLSQQAVQRIPQTPFE